ncbi:MAG: twin-arginine translocation pathway signal protein [Pseudomonadota bacterium]
MALSRRAFISLLGGGTIVAAGASAGVFLNTRTPTRALAPWDAAGTYEDPRKKALSHAILAPNPHNLQPWMVDLSTPNTVRLLRDRTRALPHTDPFDRQITIGLGCFIEQMHIAAAQFGYSVNTVYFPDGPESDNSVVAVSTFDAGGTPDPLFAHIMDRRSCKEPFEARQIESEKAAAIAKLATVITDQDDVAKIRDLTWKAWMVETQTPRTMKESVDVMRFGKAEIEANPDGIDLGGPFLESLMLIGVMSREAQLDPTSTSFAEGVKIYDEMLSNTPAYAVITSAGNTRRDQIEAGRRWLRLNLTTTGLGLALHPVSQALQEYPEMKPHYEAVHGMLAKSGETVQMLGRLGYGPQTPRTPRWPLEKKLTTA